jgi:hypothetical protein
MTNKHCKCYLIILSLLVSAASLMAADSTYLITKDGIGKVKLGMKYSEVVLLVKHDRLFKDADGWHFYSNNKSILSIYDNHVNEDEIVRSVSTANPLYHMRNGISVGMKINDFLKIFAKERLYVDLEAGLYFMPQQLKHYSYGNPEIRTILYPTFNVKNPLPKNVDIEAMKNNGISYYSKRGTISNIEIMYDPDFQERR